MSWFKLDDRFFDNPKIAGISDAAKIAYLKAGTYCARELTDGLLPFFKGKEYAGSTRVMKELVPSLWEPFEAGFQVHDYLKYNPTRAQVLAEREAAQQRMFRRRSPVGSPEQTPEQTPEVRGEVRGTPVDPDPPSVSNETVSKRNGRKRELLEADVAGLRDDFPLLNVDREAEKYVDWLRTKGDPHKDHVAGFRNWLRKAEDDAKAKRDPVGASAGGDKFSEAGERLRRRLGS